MSRVSYAVRVFTVAAGATVDIVRDAAFVTCLSATAAFKIRFDDGSMSDFEAGLTYAPVEGFQRVAILNPGAGPLVLKLGFGKGEITDARVSLNPDVQLPVRAAVPDVLTTGAPVMAADGAATLLAAANPLRREILIVSQAAATLWIGGDAGADAGEGLPLAAGQSMTLETRAAIYCRNDTGSAAALAVAELGWTA